MRYIFAGQYSRDIAYHSHTRGDKGGVTRLIGMPNASSPTNIIHSHTRGDKEGVTSLVSLTETSFFTSPHAHHDRILSPPFMNENGVDSRAPHLAYPDYTPHTKPDTFDSEGTARRITAFDRDKSAEALRSMGTHENNKSGYLHNCRLYGKWCNRCSYWGRCEQGRRGA